MKIKWTARAGEVVTAIGLSTLVVLLAAFTFGCGSGDEGASQAETQQHMDSSEQAGSGEHMGMDESGDMSATSGEGIVYTCPMHPEVQSDEPGKCPECGMYLVEAGSEGAAAEAMEDVEVWTCPMHPEVRRHEPGECPECGMDLIKADSDGGQ